MFSEGNLRGTGAGCAHRPRDELMGNKTRLAEQGTQGIKGEFMTFGRKGRKLRNTGMS